MMVIPGEELENLNPMIENKPKAFKSVHDDHHHFMQLEYITEPLFLFRLEGRTFTSYYSSTFKYFLYSCPLQKNLWFWKWSNHFQHPFLFALNLINLKSLTIHYAIFCSVAVRESNRFNNTQVHSQMKARAIRTLQVDCLRDSWAMKCTSVFPWKCYAALHDQSCNSINLSQCFPHDMQL